MFTGCLRVSVLASALLCAEHVPAAPPSAVAGTIRQFEQLPGEDIWWSVNGEAMRWNNLNLETLVRTVTVRREGQVRELAARPMPSVADFPVTTPSGPMGLRAFLDSPASTTMGVVILHRGELVFEHYPRQQAHDKPLFWSVTKVLVSTLMAILEARGEVDVSLPVDHYLPDLRGSAYAGVPVRAVLDMASGVDCGDEYEDQSSCYYRYSAAIGEGYRGPDAADNPYDFVAALPATQRFAAPGVAYSYSGVDTFVAGWVIEAVTGLTFQEALAREIWTQMGAEADGLLWASRYGIPLTSGGLMARLRDVARFGLLFTPSHGVVAERQLIPPAYLQTILHGGNPALLENAPGGSQRGADVRFNVYQWDTVYTNDDIFKGGWAGQGLLINPTRDLVAVWTGYYDADGNSIDVLPMLREVFAGAFGAPG